MSRLTISSRASKARASAVSVTGSAVITSCTGRSRSRPTASTRLRRSRSVRMPRRSPSSTTRMLETPASDMAAAALSTVAVRAVVTGSRVIRAPTRVLSTVLPLVARRRLPIARASRAWCVAA